MKILKYICLMGLISIKFSSNIGARSMRNLPKVNQKLLQNPAQQQNYGLPMAQQNNDTINGDENNDTINGDESKKKKGIPTVVKVGVVMGIGTVIFIQVEKAINSQNSREDQIKKNIQECQEIEQKLKQEDEKKKKDDEKKKKENIQAIEDERKSYFDMHFKSGVTKIFQNFIDLLSIIEESKSRSTFIDNMFIILEKLQTDTQNTSIIFNNEDEVLLLSTLQFFSFFKEKEGLLSSLKKNLNVKTNDELFTKLIDHKLFTEDTITKVKKLLEFFDTKIKLDDSNDLNEKFKEKISSDPLMVKYETQEITIKNILQEKFSFLLGEKGYFFYYSELFINENLLLPIMDNNSNQDDGKIFKIFSRNFVNFHQDMDPMISPLEILLDVFKIENTLNTIPTISDYLDNKFKSKKYYSLIHNLLFDVKDKKWSLSLLDTVNNSLKDGLLSTNKDVLSTIEQNVKALEESSNLQSKIPSNKKILIIAQIIEVIRKDFHEDYQKKRTKKIEDDKKSKSDSWEKNHLLEKQKELKEESDRLSRIYKKKEIINTNIH